MLRFLILYHYFRYFERSKSRSRIVKRQKRALDRLWSFLARHSKFYRNLGSSEKRFPVSALPILQRKNTVEKFDEMNTLGLRQSELVAFCLESESLKDWGRPFQGYTVGLSTGTLNRRGVFVVTSKEKTEYAARFVAKVLPRNLFGEHRIAYFLKADNPIYSTSKSKRMQFQYFDLSLGVEAQLEKLNAFNPTLLFAPPSALRKIADLKRKGRLDLPSIERILSGAEATDPTDGSRIEEAFGLPVFQVYQCTEGFLASSCSAGAIHLNEDSVFFEKDYLDREQKRFAPIITDLRRFAQPYVRYRMNDVLLELTPTEASIPCRCGSALSRVKSITGREKDLVRTAEGILYHDEISAVFFSLRSYFSDYMLIQISFTEIEVRISNASEEGRAKIETALRFLFESKRFHIPRFRFVEFVDGPPEVKLRRIQGLGR